MLQIDGKQGEGGGQVLRTSLALSAVTRKPFRIYDIRANRRKHGLRKQHLQCVLAAQEACNAKCEGAALNSSELVFTPGEIKGGRFEFDIKSAGSTTLVFQTILPILLHAESESTVVVKGGTHNPMAPPFEFIRDTFLPAIAHMGFHAGIQLISHGFYPNGGGEIHATVQPVDKESLSQADLVHRGDIRSLMLKVLIANLPLHIAERERAVLAGELGCSIDEIEFEMIPAPSGPGNAVVITARFDNRAAVFSAIGERGKKAEKVAREACIAYETWRSSDSSVCLHLADQLLVYAVLAHGGRYTTNEITRHFRTNADVIRSFIDADISVESDKSNLHRVVIAV